MVMCTRQTSHIVKQLDIVIAYFFTEGNRLCGRKEYSSQNQFLNSYKGFLTKSHPPLQQFSFCI